MGSRPSAGSVLVGMMVMLSGQVHAGMQDQPGRPAVLIVLAGDSTVTDEAGWGKAFAARLGPGARCLNLARSGRSSRSYRDEGHWRRVLEARPSYVLIQFGHNDQKGKGPQRETDPATSYRAFLERDIAEARQVGARPILVTPLVRRTFQKGRLTDTLGPYAEAVRAVGKEKDVAVIDLHARSREAIEALGPAAADRLGPRDREGRPDRTHLNAEGAALTAGLVVDELKRVVPELAPLFRADPPPAEAKSKQEAALSCEAAMQSVMMEPAVARSRARRTVNEHSGPTRARRAAAFRYRETFPAAGSTLLD